MGEKRRRDTIEQYPLLKRPVNFKYHAQSLTHINERRRAGLGTVIEFDQSGPGVENRGREWGEWSWWYRVVREDGRQWGEHWWTSEGSEWGRVDEEVRRDLGGSCCVWESIPNWRESKGGWRAGGQEQELV
jgi:hypothetical protein